MDKSPIEYPEYVSRNDMAFGLSCDPRTLSRLLNLKHRVTNQSISFKRLAKALRCEPGFLLDCLEGRDKAIPTYEVAYILNVPEHQVRKFKGRGPALVPIVAALAYRVRFSRNAAIALRDSGTLKLRPAAQPATPPHCPVQPVYQPLQNETQQVLT